VHGWDDDVEQLATEVVDYALGRLRLDPVPLDGPRSAAELERDAGATVTPDGIGGHEALRIVAEVLAPACISTDHPRNLSFVPCAPTEVAMLFDLVVGASSIYAGSWLEGAGAVHAENAALRWIADLAGLPDQAGGVFVQGGTTANLSAMVTARDVARRALQEMGRPEAGRWAIVVSPETHSSLAAAAAVMDVDLLTADVAPDRRLTGDAVRAVVEAGRGSPTAVEPFAVVATAGTTNLGIVDDLSTIAEAAGELGLWFHVDGAYGGAALAAPSRRGLFSGVEHADSLVVDPHKWLFAPFDCAALLYRSPELARRALSQHAGYLDVLHAGQEWNPSDYAVQLTRRARGLPFWFSLATFGTERYSQAVEATLAVAGYAARGVAARPELELVTEPTLLVVCFRRLGWSAQQYATWSTRLRRDQVGFVMPSSVDGETVARLAIVNPATSETDIDLILDSLAVEPDAEVTTAGAQTLPERS
jgi:glutamate/tyrosine decarboxylase-like PLP-dependent enzyme